MTIVLNTTEFTNENSVGVTVLKHMLEMERAGKHVHFNALKDTLNCKFTHASLTNIIHTLAEDCIIEGTFTPLPEDNDKLTYCFTIYPQYVPIVAQWIEGDYVSYIPPVWNINDQPTKQPVLENGTPNFYLS